ncbi:MAG: nucleotidyltransferase domain-containing protein [Nanoarchaeota archaeon]|nr:nucleotidyltransferase domain-containing protein [Nanoarchaeota archaeon]MBU1103251.1 nucleotidyltransferase domain-containing protein [Nanoarchaeota archaeon]
MIKAYASYFVSYLLKELKNDEKIKSIILFGSGARGEAVRDSDIDIFVDVKKKNKLFEKEIEKLLKSFNKSRESLIFKSKGVDNKINVIVGKLDEWKDLRKSIESTGIILYGRYNFGGKGEKKHAVIFWQGIGKNRGAFLNKLYGFSVKGKRYKGLVESLGGKKLGKSSIMIPVEHREEVVKVLKKYEVNAKIVEVYV